MALVSDREQSKLVERHSGLEPIKSQTGHLRPGKMAHFPLFSTKMARIPAHSRKHSNAPDRPSPAAWVYSSEDPGNPGPCPATG